MCSACRDRQTWPANLSRKFISWNLGHWVCLSNANWRCLSSVVCNNELFGAAVGVRSTAIMARLPELHSSYIFCNIFLLAVGVLYIVFNKFQTFIFLLCHQFQNDFDNNCGLELSKVFERLVLFSDNLWNAVVCFQLTTQFAYRKGLGNYTVMCFFVCFIQCRLNLRADKRQEIFILTSVQSSLVSTSREFYELGIGGSVFWWTVVREKFLTWCYKAIFLPAHSELFSILENNLQLCWWLLVGYCCATPGDRVAVAESLHRDFIKDGK